MVKNSILYVLGFILVVFIAVKLLGLAFKIAGVLIVIALAVGAYIVAQRLLGKSPS